MKQDNLASKMGLSRELSELAAEPVITPPLNSTNADQATVLFNPFFRSESSEISNYRFLAYVRTGTGDIGAISLALSEDGLRWSWWTKDKSTGENAATPVLEPKNTSQTPRRLNSPQALFNDSDGKIYLWNSWNDVADYKICLATTNDGYTFSSNEIVLSPSSGKYFDSWSVQAASILAEDGKFKMWYIGGEKVGDTGNVKDYHLGLAEYEIATGNLLSRTTEPLFPTQDSPLPATTKRLGFPRIVRYDKQYLMFFCGAADWSTTDWQIFTAVSDDGLKWTLTSQDPIFAKGGADAWNEYAVYSPSVLFRGSSDDVEDSDSTVIPTQVFFTYFSGFNQNTPDDTETKPILGQTGVTALPFSEIFSPGT